MKFWIRRYDNGLGSVVFQVVPRGSYFVHYDSAGLRVEFNTRSKAKNWIKGERA